MNIHSFFYSTSIVVLLLILSPRIATAATTFINSKAGYSISLPDNWYGFNESDSQDVFYSLTSGSKSYLSILHQKISPGTTESDWTRFHYIMYLTITEAWEDPWGTILAFDSSQNSTVNQTWAPQAYAQFVSLDSNVSNWAEYIIFTAKNGIGYELTAIGDTLDLKNNGAAYSQILQSITFCTPSAVLKYAAKKHFQHQTDNRIFDILGRNIPSARLNNKNTLVLIRSRKHYINNMR